MENLRVVGGRLITPSGVVRRDLYVVDEKIASRAGAGRARTLSARGLYVAPGLIDLHVWGAPQAVARDAARSGTTGFLTTLGPQSPLALARAVAERARYANADAADCLGIHLEGPFVNPNRAGALPRAAMRPATIRELQRLQRAACGKLRLVTLAPELPGAGAAIRWCRRRKIAVSLGHSVADASSATRAADAGARLVTHVFNGMPALHHRKASLLDVALGDGRLTTMVIADGLHVSASALKLLARAKGARRIALVTDSIRRQGWDVVRRNGAFYTRGGRLAGSDLTLLQAVKNMVELAGVSLAEAVAMASAIPAGVLGLQQSRGTITRGKRADLVAFDEHFQVHWTMLRGRLVYQRGH